MNQKFRNQSKKNIANYKPDSVILFRIGYHLSVFRVTPKNQSAYPVTQHLSVVLGEQPFKRYYTWHFNAKGLPLL